MKAHQYTHFLTIDKAVEGINLAIGNSASLLRDAQLLHDNERYERATSLSILAIEEIGKVSIIRRIVLYNDLKSVRDSWKEYRNHTSKNVMWLLSKHAGDGANKLDDYQSMFEDKDGRRLLDNVKQISLYTDCYGKCSWSAPSEVIDKQLSKSILELASWLIREDKNRTVSRAEMEVWVKHMKPALKLSMKEAKVALVKCYEEMERLGYVAEGSTESMSQFVNDGIVMN